MIVKIVHPDQSEEIYQTIDNGAGVIQWRNNTTGGIRPEQYGHQDGAWEEFKQLFPASRFNTQKLEDSLPLIVPMDKRQPQPLPRMEDDDDEETKTSEK